jgi:hypothetical protein
MDARQAMLDELDRRDKESMISYRDENAKSLAEERNALALERKEKADQVFQNRIPPGAVTGATADRLQQIDPSSVDVTGGATLPSKQMTGVGAPLGQVAPMQDTQSPSVADSSVPITKTYKGSADYRMEQDRNSKLQALTKSPEFQQGTDLERWIMMRSVMQKGENPPAEAIFHPKPTPAELEEPLMTFNEATGKYETAKDENGHVIMGKKGERPVIRSRPPVGPQGPAPEFFQYDDAQGNHKTVWVKPGAAFPTDMNPKTLRKGNEPAPRAATLGLYDKALASKFSSAKPQDKPQVAAALINSITDRNVQADVRGMIQDNNGRKKSLTVDQFFDAGLYTAPPGEDPELYREKVREAMTAIGAK